MVNYDQILKVAKKAANEAGQIILSGAASTITLKSLSDYVTDVDLSCQKCIISSIKKKFPDHKILAEEDGQSFTDGDNLWIIDPLDGTTNYIHELKHSAVSIAFYSEGEIKVGVIYNPYTGEMFHSIKGKGSYLNSIKISVSSRKDMKSSLIATGMPFRKHEKIPKYFACLSEVLRNSSGIRRMGSASMDMAYTACGRFDGFFEGWLSPWDIAAGILIIEEAGGVITDFKGKRELFEHGCVVCSNVGIKDQLFNIVNKNLGDEQ